MFLALRFQDARGLAWNQMLVVSALCLDDALRWSQASA